MIETEFLHITCRRPDKQPLFNDDRDYLRFLKHLETAVVRHAWRCHSYCLMPTHYHLLVEVGAAGPARGMLLLNGAYARYFNWRNQTVGHVFERKYHAEFVARDEHLLETFRYIAMNPVKAGLCDRPEEWRWSSYRATANLEPAPHWLEVDFTRRTCAPYGGYSHFCNQIAAEAAI